MLGREKMLYLDYYWFHAPMQFQQNFAKKQWKFKIKHDIHHVYGE